MYLCRYGKDVINIVGCSSCRWSRNFDGNYGEMVVVFNHNVKPGEHKSVMMTDLNSAQKFSGIEGYAGDKILLESGKELNVLLRQPCPLHCEEPD